MQDYPNCNVSYPKYIGDGYCHGGDFNTVECGFDGGDCEDFNKYPNCSAPYPGYIGDGSCYGGDYNTAECGFDGGDCVDFNNKYPNCNDVAFPSQIGDGYCNGNNYGSYNTAECGFDGGDCVDFNNKYPDCNVAFPYMIGDGDCHHDYNTAACGFDGGDCDFFNRSINKVINKYPDCSNAYYLPWRIGDGRCNDDYNTAECGFDDGDCGNPNSFPVWPVVGGVAGAFLFIAIGIVIGKKKWNTSTMQETAGGAGVQTGNAKDDMNNQQEERFPDVEATGSSARNIHKPVLQSQGKRETLGEEE
eukprot:scaffold10570_cov290-Chaetoceros_neogracile.AAC.33